MKRSISYLFLILACVTTLPACAGLMYSAEPMEARVVDAESKKSLEGVIVVAHWELERGTVGGSVPAGQLMVMEAVTNKTGKFAFPGFGPKPAVTSHLVHKDPELILFKSGYRYLVLTNEYSGDIKLRTRAVRRSEWNGKTIELKPFKGSLEEYEKHLAFLKTSLGFAYNGENCEWKLVPRMLVSQHREKLRLDKAGIFNTVRSVDSVAGQKQCGSAKEFFRDYLP